MRGLLIAWAATVALCDWRWRRLPNWLTLGALCCGGVWLLMSGSGPVGASVGASALAFATGTLALLPAYLVGWLGAGDVKLFAAMGLLGGMAVLLPTLLVACLVSGLIALLVLLREGRRPGRRIPFGIGLALGFILAVGAL